MKTYIVEVLKQNVTIKAKQGLRGKVFDSYDDLWLQAKKLLCGRVQRKRVNKYNVENKQCMVLLTVARIDSFLDYVNNDSFNNDCYYIETYVLN
jgi:hypothetical protein